MWSYAVTPLDQLRLGPPDQTSGLDLPVVLDVLDKTSQVRIRQNFRVEAPQRGLQRLLIDFYDSYAQV